MTTATRKTFISHIDKMKPLDFIALMRGLTNGDLNSIEISEKIDGSVLRFGQSQDNRFFIESSTSSAMFNAGDFEKRDLSKGYPGNIGRLFDNILREFLQNENLKSFLSRHNNGNGIKIIGEILYVPMGNDHGDKISFIRIKYDRDKLGKIWTFVPFNVVDDDGNSYNNDKEIMHDLCNLSDEHFKYVLSTISFGDHIDLSNEMLSLNRIIDKHPNINEILVSRKHCDADEKSAIIDKIVTCQRDAAKKILSYITCGIFGSDFEGIVIRLVNDKLLKVVSDAFKNSTFNKL
jgi:hypothetical protein